MKRRAVFVALVVAISFRAGSLLGEEPPRERRTPQSWTRTADRPRAGTRLGDRWIRQSVELLQRSQFADDDPDWRLDRTRLARYEPNVSRLVRFRGRSSRSRTLLDDAACDCTLKPTRDNLGVVDVLLSARRIPFFAVSEGGPRIGVRWLRVAVPGNRCHETAAILQAAARTGRLAPVMAPPPGP